MSKNIRVVLVSILLLAGCSDIMPGLGINNSKLTPCPESPNCVNSQAETEIHYIQPIHYTGTQQEAYGRLMRILASEKRTNILTVQENYIWVEFTSALLRFVDDVEFYFPEDQADNKVIHVRSASRVGYSDMGVNRKRIEHIRSKFE